MKIVNAEDDLLPEVLGFDFSHLPIGLSLQVAVQGAAVDVFHDEEDLLVRLEGLKELGEALVIYLFHDLDLPLHALPPIWFQQLELLVYLDSDLLVENLVEADPDNCVGPLAYSFSNYVIVDVLDVAAFGAELILVMLTLLTV